ncbi:DUF2092 domain-containing protein [Jeongeupia naejangsanensis]|uniref:DUF2092 domain-containing protein n=1 Tax=Jeongeupia naejangsanensis TaxID=613195 RepID=A0ABS2BLW4_9NEIS|nr:DUF2092 domain-containing protein [Jeongeupia naejangsanensis]MBM3116609.1 DUF2092 domain-containing protein [Jeongeupia naejangsanensis]
MLVRTMLGSLSVIALLGAGTAGAEEVKAAGDSKPAEATAPVRETRAIEALQRMSRNLRSLKSFEVTSHSDIDRLDDAGQLIKFSNDVTYKVALPNRLYASIVNGRANREMYYDGQQFTLYGKKLNYYATVKAPATVGELVATLDEKYGIQLPLTDLFLWGTDHAPVNDIQAARYVGASVLGKQVCDQYAYRQGEVDWQLWISRGDKPLPCKLAIVDSSDAARPQAVMSYEWRADARIAASTFKFTAPKNAHPIVLNAASAADKQ